MEPLRHAAPDDDAKGTPSALRRVAVLVRRGTDGARLRDLMRQLVSVRGAEVRVMSSRPGRVTLDDASRISVAHGVSGACGDSFDCVYVVEGGESTQRLADRLVERIFLRAAIRGGVPVFSLQRPSVAPHQAGANRSGLPVRGPLRAESSRFQMA